MSQEFESLKKEIMNCSKCELSASRNNVIFGEGSEQAPLFIIGEAPGREEDIGGRPFIGQSGQLLDKILAACGFTRSKHVFISNIIRCRPPGNRIPTQKEVESCMPYLIRQVEIIDPKIIILLGSTALRHFAGKEWRITKDHGKWIPWENKQVMPVYHPAALLRDPSLKRGTWEDFKKVVWKYRELVDPHHHSDYV